MDIFSKILRMTTGLSTEAEKNTREVASLIHEIKDQISSIAGSVTKIAERVRTIEEVVVIHQRAIEEMYKLQKSFNESTKDRAVDSLVEKRKIKIEKPN